MSSITAGPDVRARRGLAFTLTLLLSAGIAACARTEAQRAEPPPPQVTVAEVAASDVTEWDEFTGRLEAVDVVAVRPRVSGYISSVDFQEGSIVDRGDLLVQIDPRPFQTDVDRLSAELARARATVARARSELARAERLAEAQAISQEELDRRASFAVEADAQVAAMDAALRAAELNLEFTRVVAPITGRVGRAIVTEGNLVTSGPGEATLLTTVVSLDPIYASFDADEQIYLRYAALARRGSRADARNGGLHVRMARADEDGFPHEGRLNFLDNQLDPSTGTIRARAVFPNRDGALTPGLFVRVQVPGRTPYRGVVIEDRAIGTDLDKRFVYVVTPESTVAYRPVILGPIIDGRRVVRSGLEQGDLVVVNGLQRVRPGALVDPVREEARP